MYATQSQAKAPSAASRQDPLIYAKRRLPTRIHSSEPQNVVLPILDQGARSFGQLQDDAKGAPIEAPFGHNFSRIPVYPKVPAKIQNQPAGAATGPTSALGPLQTWTT